MFWALICFARPASAVSFVVTYDQSTANAPAGFLAAFNYVINFYQTELTDPITINLHVGWGEVNGRIIPSGALGTSLTNEQGNYTYNQIKAALVSHARTLADVTAIANLPASDPTGGGSFLMANAEAKALGLLTGNASGVDGYVGFDKTASYTFDPNNRAVAREYDFIGIAEHEISEVMGRYCLTSGMYAPLNLFRYTGPGALAPVPGNRDYFSIDGGNTVINTFNGTGGGDVGDWLGNTPDSYNANAALGTKLDVSTGDITLMDVIGYTPVAGSEISSPLRFVPVSPCRIADTRNANGTFGGPELSAGSTRDFPIPNGSCGVPSTAAAYALNVTVVPDAQLGYLSIWPSGQTQPLVSTLNSDGRVKANAAIVPAGNKKAISVFVTDSTHLVLDITGYFEPDGTSVSELQFYPLAPCRVADTRQGSGPFGAPFLSGGAAARSFPVQASSCNIPAAARAYSLNFTVVPHGPLGYITVWPAGQKQPLISTLNASTGAVTANAAIVSTGAAGQISIYASNDTDLVIDINGYFAPPGSGGLDLFTVAPCRVLDTRNPPGSAPFNGMIVTNVGGSSCLPQGNGAQAFVLNATVVPPGPLGFLSLWPDAQAQPLVSTLNALDAAITSNMAILPGANGSIDAFAANPTQLILDISGYFAP